MARRDCLMVFHYYMVVFNYYMVVFRYYMVVFLLVISLFSDIIPFQSRFVKFVGGEAGGLGSMSENNDLTSFSRQEPVSVRAHRVKLFCLRLPPPIVIDTNIEVSTRLSLKMPASCVFPYHVFC